MCFPTYSLLFGGILKQISYFICSVWTKKNINSNFSMNPNILVQQTPRNLSHVYPTSSWSPKILMHVKTINSHVQWITNCSSFIQFRWNKFVHNDKFVVMLYERFYIQTIVLLLFCPELAQILIDWVPKKLILMCIDLLCQLKRKQALPLSPYHIVVFVEAILVSTMPH